MPLLNRILGKGNSVGRAIFALLLVGCLSACDSEPVATVGQPAPEFQAFDLDGEAVKIANLRGNVVVVNFWLGGCAPCITEAPIIQEVLDTYRNDGLAVVSINVGGNSQIVKDFIEETNTSFDFAVDQLSLTAMRYGVAGFPTTFIVDRNGLVRERFLGEVRPGTLDRTLAPLL